MNNNNEKIFLDENTILNQIFFDKYKCIQKIGEGSFGLIYKAEYKGNYYAIKFEKKNSEQSLLENEAAIMNYLKGPNIPYINAYGSNDNFNILVMQLLGKNLGNYFEEKKIFSIKTVCMLANQFISILEYIHNRHIIHRDIKPDNFVMGLNDLSQYVYILDFGLAKKYRSSTTQRQYPYIHRGKIIGTARYASINALKGYELSRRDDLEAIGYVLVYFIKGRLPWQGLATKTKEERYKKILEKKIEITSAELCEDLPEEFEKFLEYAKNLEYLEQPDYEMLRGLFNTVLRKEHYKFDYIYDWTTSEERLKRRIVSSRSEIESTQNRKSTLITYNNKFYGDSREENENNNNNCVINNFYKNKFYGDSREENENNNNICVINNFYKNNYFSVRKSMNKKIAKEEIDKSNSIFNIKTYRKHNEIKEEEEEIIIPTRKNNKKKDEVCCNMDCNIF